MMEWGIKDIEIRDNTVDIEAIKKEISLPLVYDCLEQQGLG